ncbi:hypothetical protein TL16_g06231 [Triparma laevis f. inornata]|uniref:NTF2 domain-containing protein n=1 Tax=Triparma laevis f. inornata TaxID=1714386 RepID=A0A9W7AJV3_9STRA|nr:hypothetical protein TL16_g06231 [Triparma laevis f. inornata]
MSAKDNKADSLGLSFVQKYYQLLTTEPATLYKFYSPTATLKHSPTSTFSEIPTLSDSDSIKEFFSTFKTGERVIDLNGPTGMIDCQAFSTDAYIIIVHGLISKGEEGEKTKFCQVFGLSKEETGKYMVVVEKKPEEPVKVEKKEAEVVVEKKVEEVVPKEATEEEKKEKTGPPSSWANLFDGGKAAQPVKEKPKKSRSGTNLE